MLIELSPLYYTNNEKQYIDNYAILSFDIFLNRVNYCILISRGVQHADRARIRQIRIRPVFCVNLVAIIHNQPTSG